MIKHTDFQDEMGFPSQTPINSQNDHVSFKGQKKDVPDKNLSHQTNRERLKVMVSAAFACLGVAKPLFINKKGLEVNAENYCKHLKKSYILWKDLIFIPDDVPLHTSNLVPDFLKKTISRRYNKIDHSPPKLPDSNPLNNYFWNKLKTTVYEDKVNPLSENEGKFILQNKIGLEGTHHKH